MKVYPQDIEDKLGFDQIREHLIRFCQSRRGEELAEKAKPTERFEVLLKWLTQAKEMIRLKSSSENVLFEFPDIDEYLIQVKVPGSFLDPEHFHELKRGVNTLTSWISFFQKKGNEYSELLTLSSHIEIDPNLAIHIEKTIDERGEVKDSASKELSEIRTKISKSERAVRSAIQKVLKRAKEDQFTEEDSTLTVRDGRLVIPIKAEHKKRIQGFVHDESATGQTVYLEPGEVLELNNQVRELKYAEKREVIRILIELSDHVRANLPNLQKGADLIEKLDFIHAKALLSDLINGIVPEIEKSSKFALINAVHPLLYLSHKGSGKPVIPLNLSLDQEKRILIISGPNAGGKSVALKTVGLLQYMLQTGLPVPISEESKMGIFSSIFIDIGDTQSLEDDLSTYSSHLTSMNYFLEHTNKKSLFLIDEFGKGTEPQFGGAIAESVLNELNQKRAFGIITTHYQNLKKIGDETPGLINGAMKYDLDALEPLFELEVGKPGSSFAFEIAGKIGLPNQIIASARKKIGSSHVAYDQLLNQLEKEKAKFEKQTKKLEKDQADIHKVRKDYEELRKMLEEDKARIIKEAKKEASHILANANKDVERTIREIKESKASKERTKAAREKLDRKKTHYKEQDKRKPNPLKEGDVVKLIGQETAGTIQKIKGKQAEVLFGALKSIVSIDNLQKANDAPQVSYQKKVKQMGINLTDKMANFDHEISIRGMRADEAISRVESFIDEALLVGVDEIRIVHGKGHGVLREIVRNITKGHPGISSVEDEHADRGGAGISIIKLQ
ncbi:DNA mismatch repair protein MutS2 [Ekhidna lutea]|uniref:Endonuclease MutS2 n=1 Tax=Ekhidna lutea TaxID=447679 RepID=A0A239M0I1_EKHLU|nr:endonuclease MutS2 [Ekhidna lutea]SNT36181.1 DNA mismatch repair protein MutS2 [Ekhidna lutea]